MYEQTLEQEVAEQEAREAEAAEAADSTEVDWRTAFLKEIKRKRTNSSMKDVAAKYIDQTETAMDVDWMEEQIAERLEEINAGKQEPQQGQLV